MTSGKDYQYDQEFPGILSLINTIIGFVWVLLILSENRCLRCDCGGRFGCGGRFLIESIIINCVSIMEFVFVFFD
jgi:hypothetical protein